MKRQIDDENKGGKISIISNKMGQAIRNETTMGGDWDNLVVRALLCPRFVLFPRQANQTPCRKRSRSRRRRRRWR